MIGLLPSQFQGLQRNTVDVLETVRMLKALKPPAEVVFQKENIRTLDEDGEVMLTVYSGLAQEESRSLAESVAWVSAN